MLHASCTTLGEDLLVRRLHDFSDANINTLVELSDVQFTEGTDTILKTNNVGGATN
jgi:hypothetical protein